MSKKLSALLLSTAVLAGMTLFTTSVRAEGEGANDPKTPEKSVYLTKTFQTPENYTNPESGKFTFEFSFTQKDYYPYGESDGEGNPREPQQPFAGPQISDRKLTFSNADKGDGDPNDGGKTTFKQTDDILAGLTFTTPGVYTYTVREKNGIGKPGGIEIIKDTAKEKETMQYDIETYTLKIYVTRDKDGNIVNEGATIIDDDTGKKVEGGKETPTPGGSTGEEGTETITGNGFNFENIYTKKANSVPDPDPDPDPDIDNASFKVKKMISGGLAKAEDKFDFTIVFTPNKLVTDKTNTAKFSIKDGTSNEVTSQDLVFDKDANGAFVPKTMNFQLKGKDIAWVDNLPVGVKYEVKENLGTGMIYDQFFAQTVNGTVVGEKAGSETSALLGDGRNSVDYRNNAEAITPTGLLLNNLPYIFMAVAAVAGFGAYVALKRHQRN